MSRYSEQFEKKQNLGLEYRFDLYKLVEVDTVWLLGLCNRPEALQD